ncbi:glycosyltransferase family protein [Rhodospirillales bacterium]|nr:glycosyltransferase family protein [Rhodospirillales bacterium]
MQARMSSTRLPGKIALPLAGEPMLQRVVERAQAIPGVDCVCVAAPEGVVHDPIVDMLEPFKDVVVVRGPEYDVLRRYALAADATDATTVIRITSDCPLIDPQVSGAVLALANSTGSSFARTALDSGYPHGYDTEIFSAELLRIADRDATDPYDREHVSPYLWARSEEYPAVFLDRRPDRRFWRVTVDTPEDYARVSRIYDRLHPQNPLFGIKELEALCTAEPEYLTDLGGETEAETY